jgi:hypothetical protein
VPRQSGAEHAAGDRHAVADAAAAVDLLEVRVTLVADGVQVDERVAVGVGPVAADRGRLPSARTSRGRRPRSRLPAITSGLLGCGRARALSVIGFRGESGGGSSGVPCGNSTVAQSRSGASARAPSMSVWTLVRSSAARSSSGDFLARGLRSRSLCSMNWARAFSAAHRWAAGCSRPRVRPPAAKALRWAPTRSNRMLARSSLSPDGHALVGCGELLGGDGVAAGLALADAAVVVLLGLLGDGGLLGAGRGSGSS